MIKHYYLSTIKETFRFHKDFSKNKNSKNKNQKNPQFQKDSLVQNKHLINQNFVIIFYHILVSLINY